MKKMKKSELYVNYTAYETTENLLKEFRTMRNDEIDRLLEELNEAKKSGKTDEDPYIVERWRQINTLDEMYENLTKWRDRYCYR